MPTMKKESVLPYCKFEKLLNQKRETVYQISKNTGIPNSTFTDWKSGRSEPKIEKLLILSNYFNVPVEYFARDDLLRSVDSKEA